MSCGCSKPEAVVRFWVATVFCNHCCLSLLWDGSGYFYVSVSLGLDSNEEIASDIAKAETQCVCLYCSFLYFFRSKVLPTNITRHRCTHEHTCIHINTHTYKCTHVSIHTRTQVQPGQGCCSSQRLAGDRRELCVQQGVCFCVNHAHLLCKAIITHTCTALTHQE